ncbi:MAG TPA: protein phosphatase 2C domain-containing protein [Rhizomicrobium sp.]
MLFTVLDTLSLSGDPNKPNDDAFGHIDTAAVVLDGATSLGDPLMPGDSDAAWIAHFGARRLMAHMRDGDAPLDALRHALGDAQKSFEALRRAAPKEKWQIPSASMMFVSSIPAGFEALFFGDCVALVARPGAPVEVVGEAFDKKAAESRRAAKLAKEKGVAPASRANLPEFLEALRAARNHINSGSHWAFTPEPRAADHVRQASVPAPPGSHLLLASDGFLAIASDYGRYSAHTLMDKAIAKGLGILADELREIEDADPQGHKFPRFKKSDDATAVLLRLA